MTVKSSSIAMADVQKYISVLMLPKVVLKSVKCVIAPLPERFS